MGQYIVSRAVTASWFSGARVKGLPAGVCDIGRKGSFYNAALVWENIITEKYTDKDMFSELAKGIDLEVPARILE